MVNPVEREIAELEATELEASAVEDGTVRYALPRALTPLEHAHPLAESGWKALGHTTLDGEADTLLLEKNGKHRVVELFEDYAWASDKRCLVWEDFVRLETEDGDRRGWTQAIAEKLESYGHAVPHPKVWVARNDTYGADWLLGLEF
jgi:hypothetical protein